MRQAGAHHDHGKARLADLVAGGTERRHVVRSEVLHLVDEDPDPLAEVGCESADVGEELDQVDLDVAGVRAPPHRGHVDPGTPLVAQLRAGAGLPLCEGADHPEHVVDRLGLGMPELADRLVQGTGQGAAQPLVGPRLELAGPPLTSHRGRAQGVEQDRLADPPQPGEDQAALRTAVGDPLQDDVEGTQLLVATGELGGRWPAPGA